MQLLTAAMAAPAWLTGHVGITGGKLYIYFVEFMVPVAFLFSFLRRYLSLDSYYSSSSIFHPFWTRFSFQLCWWFLGSPSLKTRVLCRGVATVTSNNNAPNRSNDVVKEIYGIFAQPHPIRFIYLLGRRSRRWSKSRSYPNSSICWKRVKNGQKYRKEKCLKSKWKPVALMVLEIFRYFRCWSQHGTGKPFLSPDK